MSLELEQMKGALARFAQQFGPDAIVSATVVAVNENETVKIRFAEGGEIDDCRLKAVVKDGNEYLLIPVVDSPVLVGRIEDSGECIVLAVSEISEVKSKIGNTTLSQTAAGFLLKKGSDGLREVLELIIEAVMVTVVVQGNNPDKVKLQQALTKVKNLLRNATE